MSKLRTTPLIMNSTDGVVSGVVGMVVDVLLKTRLLMLLKKIDGCTLSGVFGVADDDLVRRRC